MKTTHKEYNVQTGEETFIEREETTEERVEREATELLATKVKEETEATAIAKAALLAKLGITAEEAQLLLS